jgi:predicted alpha-1,2-mannosidase
VAKARASIEREVSGKSFDEVADECAAAWEALLRRFRVEGGDAATQRLFYTLLYRLHCMPTDLGVDDENPKFASGRRHFTDFYCLWDSIRNANSFYHLFEPELSSEMMNSLLDIARHSGWLPDAHIAHQHAYMQSACAADILFSEAAQKGVPGVDYRQALEYCAKNAEVPSPNPLVKGRYLDDYHGLGYLSTRVPKSSVSRHIEYTYHDHCIARLAELVGEAEIAARFADYASRLFHLFQAEVGSFWPRHADGSWLVDHTLDAWKLGREGWNDPYAYEATLAEWTMNAFHDLYGLIERMGGNAAFIAHLDRLFDEHLFNVKETKMHIPHLYTYAGRPDLAADRVRTSLRVYREGRDGLSDNEDMGCQSAYYLWNSMGLYPIYGQTHYLLVPPVFDSVRARLGEGSAELEILCTRRGSGRYIERATLNGRELDRAWVLHREIAAGATLSFELSDTRSDWGTRKPPPRAR